jgi:Fur family ferric uptake transcriptional regulator
MPVSANGRLSDRNGQASPETVTVPRTAPPLAAPDLDAAVGALRGRGLRVSAARRLVLAALYATDEPLSAERIAAGLEGRLPRSDLASVYRNLEMLEAVGLVRHFHLGHGPGLYAHAGEEREYLMCDSCRSIRAVEPAELDAVRTLIGQRFGLAARFQHFPIVGLCRQCRSTGLAERGVA